MEIQGSLDFPLCGIIPTLSNKELSERGDPRSSIDSFMSPFVGKSKNGSGGSPSPVRQEGGGMWDQTSPFGLVFGKLPFRG